ncbi:MAG: DUF262 domain-containing protein [Clostridia bacterium]|nr:DUF262 domain-containing protein [Clostridia bacterium]
METDIKENYIDEITLDKLERLNFIIKGYQRGYKWETKHIEKLIQDLCDFIDSNPNKDDYYCLQTIVVKKIGENIYELIDGQQRLITIYILLKMIYENRDEDLSNGKFYFEFERDKNKEEKIGDFLSNIVEKSKEENNDYMKNLDAYYMKNAYRVIKKCMKKRKEEKNSFLGTELEHLFYNDKKVKFIWYEVNESTTSTSEEIFSRINMGKIPLTNSELIKAEILSFNKSDNIKLKQLKIVSEWDNIENKLQNEEFWEFIRPKKDNFVNKIEFIFDYAVKREDDKLKIDNKKEKQKNEFYIYDRICNIIEKEKKQDINIEIDDIWKKYVRNYFETLMEWYEDIEIYNMIGYLNLFDNENTIYELMNTYNSCKHRDKEETDKDDTDEEQINTKEEFKEKLKGKIRETIKEIDIEELEYESEDGKNGKSGDNKRIQKILFLFNILTSIDSNDRFLFNKLNDRNVSLEHIHPQNPEGMEEKYFPEWINSTKQHLYELKNTVNIQNIDNNLDENIEKILEKALQKIREFEKTKKTQRKDFKKLFDDVIELLDYIYDAKGNKDLHSIQNLALLSRTMNSKLNNSLFESKREKIIECSNNKEFYIPICTKNVFFKYYSNKAKSLYLWTSEDREDYLEKIIKRLADFLPEN